MSHLVLKDNICASVACKTWREAALSVRVVEKHPWLLCFCKPGGSLIKLQYPLECKSYALDLVELANSTVCYSRDGWLVMHRLSSNDLFFFNPFSKEVINLPKLEFPFVEIAFSCPPTSDHCVVVTLDFVAGERDQGRRLISNTCHSRATEWITEEFPDYLRPFIMHSKLVYLNDRFYCFNAGGSCLSISMIDSIALPHEEAACILCTYLPVKGIYMTPNTSVINSNGSGKRNKSPWKRRKESTFSCLHAATRSQ